MADCEEYTANCKKGCLTKSKVTKINFQDCHETFKKVNILGQKFRENGLSELMQVKMFLAEKYQDAISEADLFVNGLNTEFINFNSTQKRRFEELEIQRKQKGAKTKSAAEISDRKSGNLEMKKNVGVSIKSKSSFDRESVKIENDELADFDFIENDD